MLVYPAGKQPEFLDKAEEVLPVPDLVAELQLTVGDLFGWLKLG